jgi:ABC-type dipeptide/oligopeptide/nickel transport system permease subunit
MRSAVESARYRGMEHRATKASGEPVTFPALAVMLAVLAFNLLGDAWRDWLDPRTRQQMAALDLTR